MHGTIGSQRPKTARRLAVLIALALLVAIGVALSGIWSRMRHEASLTKETEQQAIASVAVIRPERGVSGQELVLPGNTEAWYEAPIYARVPGYLKMWYKDYGARVKQGDLLAEIDTPDLDQQLAKGKAKLAEATANQKLAEVTAQRWRRLLGSESVSQQETDVKVADAEAKKALVQAAQADVDRLQALESFKRLVAPFDGIVTARNTDIGGLIDVGASTTREPALFKVADLHMMRVYVQVPQAYSAEVRNGMRTELYLPQYPGRKFPAVVATTSSAINTAARTLLVELHANNPDGLLLPGTYADVHFLLPGDPDMLRVPSSALIFQKEGLQVATVGPAHKVVLKSITVGRDLGTEVEVIAGLAPDDTVIDSPPASLSAGEQVRVIGTGGAPSGTPEEAAAAGAK
jgi:membrane fusion protein, multidrug efflux system